MYMYANLDIFRVYLAYLDGITMIPRRGSKKVDSVPISANLFLYMKKYFDTNCRNTLPPRVNPNDWLYRNGPKRGNEFNRAW